VDFEVYAYEVARPVGCNGAKSTLVKVISRIYSPDHGEISMDGVPVPFVPPMMRCSSASRPYQIWRWRDNLDVVANLFLGREELSRGRGHRQVTRSRWSTAARAARAPR
jgi:ABC-type sugar transport system ATPase subunit